MNKWDQRYQSRTEPGEPCWVLQHNQHLLPASGRALDLACGLGANALLLAENNLQTHAWDNSVVALQKLSECAAQQQFTIQTLQRDVEQNPPEPESFDVIVVSQFLYRPIFSALVKALKPGGLLFYQTFHRLKQSPSGPSNPDFLLAPGELLRVFADLQLLFYREDADVGDLTKGLRDCSYFVGSKPDN